MRVVNIISGKDLGGPKQSFIDYGKMLSNLGMDVHYIVRPNAACLQHLQNIPKNQINIVNYYRQHLFNSYSVNNLKKTLMQIKPQFIFAHKQYDLYLLRQAYPHAKIIGIIHGFNAKQTEHADQLIAVSKAVLKFLKNNTKTPAIHIPNVIDMSETALTKPDRKIPVIGTMAVFRRKKRLEDLIKACYLLKKQKIKYKLLIAGRGHRRFWLKGLITFYRLNEYVTLLEWVNDKNKFLQNIDIYCVSSKTESFNISLIEAMAQETAVIASKCGGPNEIIVNHDSGLLYPVGDIKKLTQLLKYLIEEPTVRKKLGMNARLRTQDKYQLDLVQNLIQRHILTENN